MALLSEKQFVIVGGLALVVGVVAVVKVRGAVGRVSEAAGAVVQAVNPVNHDNVVNRGVTKAVQGIVGNDVDTLGTALYGLWERFRGDGYPSANN